MLRYAAKIVTRKVGFTAKCPRATLDSDRVMYVLRWAVRNGPALMIHTILLAALGVVLIGVLSAILEMIGLKNHPWIARILAALCVGVAAYIHWGHHSWVGRTDRDRLRFHLPAGAEGRPRPATEKFALTNLMLSTISLGIVVSV